MKKLLILALLLWAPLAFAGDAPMFFAGEPGVTTSEILGTVNQVTVTDNGDGTVTVSTPQDLDTEAEVAFANVTVPSGVFNGLFFTGDSGTAKIIHREADDALLFYFSDALQWNLNAAHLKSITSGGPQINDEVSSATNPTFLPNRNDSSTGVGGISGEVSIITGGVEAVNIDSSQLMIPRAGIGGRGELYFDANGASTMDTATSTTAVIVNGDGAQWTTGITNGTTLDTVGGSITVTDAGYYDYSASISFSVASGAPEILHFAAVNDVIRPKCHSHRTITGATIGVVPITCQLELSANDVVSLFVNASTGTPTVQHEAVNQNLKR